MSYFNKHRKRKAIEDIGYFYDCAERAGIRHALFVGFGLLLGMVREKDFIGHDNDVDMCLRADLITEEQEKAYVNYLAEDENYGFKAEEPFKSLTSIPKCGMFSKRCRFSYRGDTGRLTWFSLRKDNDHCKFCHWLFFPWNGYMWHTKAGKWVNKRKFNQNTVKFRDSDEAIFKGIPQGYVEELKTVSFHGLKVNIPVRYGSCLDFWYPHWIVPRSGGSSQKNIVCVVGKWDNKKTWKVRI